MTVAIVTQPAVTRLYRDTGSEWHLVLTGGIYDSD